jgi:type II secretion system protein G
VTTGTKARTTTLFQQQARPGNTSGGDGDQMAGLANSKRSLLQATYTPIGTPGGGGPEEASPVRRLTRAWEKWGFVAGLRPSPDELAALRDRLGARTQPDGAAGPAAERLAEALQVIESTIPGQGSPDALRSAPHIGALEADVLVEIGQNVLALRRQRTDAVLERLRALEAARVDPPRADAQGQAEEPLPPGWEPVPRSGPLSPPDAQIYRYESVEEVPAGEAPGAPAGADEGRRTSSVSAAMLVPMRRHDRDLPRLTVPPPTVRALAERALERADAADDVTRTVALARRLSPSGLDLTPNELAALAAADLEQQQALVEGFSERIAVEPIGYLHLERIAFTPAGIERGELVYSLPLAPEEEVHISHKEWSNTSEEFEKIVTDFVEDYSEEGVSEKADLTQATESQNQHSSGFNTGVTASGQYGAVNITASAGYNVAASASDSEKFSRTQSSAITRKASSRTRREHKISFRIGSASGLEDQTIRKIRNPFSDRATRADYYQLMRKWQVELYRYGIRLTYDLAIPEPGSDILSKIQEINAIQAALQYGFGDPKAPLWAQFTLKPTDLNPDNYAEKAAEYNATVEPPPDEPRYVGEHATHQWASLEEANTYDYFALDLTVDQNYEVVEATIKIHITWFPGSAAAAADKVTQPEDLARKSGKLTVVYWARFCKRILTEVRLKLRVKASVGRAWQLKAWSTIRDAAQARYYEKRQALRERLASLQEELGGQDALSLRKIEREEVMKGVLRWLLGPTFKFMPPEIPDELYGPDASVKNDQVWGDVLSHGELIKFLHHAVEWENMLYFLYPYFWTHRTKWEAKKYLDHPDPMHRIFLKAGSARVVLTIRPGFERAFTAFVELGEFKPLPPEHPYLKITEEMENYARTNYPGISAANPIQDARPLLQPQQRRTWDDMRRLMRLLEAYHEANGSYPTTEQGLAALEPYTSPDIPTVPLKDQWENDFVYRAPGRHGDYDLVSYGADGVPGGTAENADITSWAEASLIGLWHEYTPTSAMDILFDAGIPVA